MELAVQGNSKCSFITTCQRKDRYTLLNYMILKKEKNKLYDKVQFLPKWYCQYIFPDSPV